MRIFRTLLSLLLALCGLTAAAQELTVTSLTSNAADGIVLTFSQDVKVSHSIFDTKCYNSIKDDDAIVKDLNASPTTKGNVVTLAAAWCTFVNGHHMHLELNPACFTTLDGATQLTGETAFDFVMGDGAAAEPITALQIAPANGTLTQLGNISVVFDPTITEIVDPEGFTITNEKGHSLPIIDVIIDGETSIKSLNVNIHPTLAELQEGTTYSLHIAPGTLKCGSITNETELVYGKWFIKPEPLMLVTDPPHQRLVESVSQVTVRAENGGALRCIDMNSKDIVVTGIMEDQNKVFATVTSISAKDRTSVTLTLDKPVSMQLLDEIGARSNYVKFSIPAGIFQQSTKYNEACQMVWKIGTPKPLGDVIWNFSPSPDSKFLSLGTPLTVEREDAENYEVYILRFGITGQDAFMTITDAENIKIVDTNSGETIRTFDRSVLKQEGTNAFMLVMDAPITQSGRYSLVIPAASVNYYSDAEHYSAPQHPDADVTATWTVYNASVPFYGDANGDGIISASDVAKTIDALVHPDANAAILKNVDFDYDGQITLADIQRLLNIVLRKK